jgi:dihydroxyacetone kinase-like protein
MGMALSSCTVPAAGKPTFELGEGEMEMGVGIHGEPGRKRMPHRPAKELAALLTEAILADLPLRGGDRVIALVTGMGGTPLLELYLMYRELDLILGARQINVARRLVGNYITSLDMAGCAITLLQADDELLSLWDDPVLTPALRWGI